MYIELAIFVLFVFWYSLVSGRLERAPASGPIVYVVGPSEIRRATSGTGWGE
jgi:hypothetical protein